MDQPTHSWDTQQQRGAGARTARRLARLAAVLGVLAVGLVVWHLVSAQRAVGALQVQADADAALVVATTHPRAESGTLQLVLPGTLQANYDAPIYARTDGYLKRWLVDIGTPVKTGQLLAQIESPEVDQELRQAQADLAAAEANHQIADVTAERWRKLRATDSVSKQDADEKISLAASSDAQVQAARANVQRLRELSGFERIVAPFDGVVTARDTDVGQLINSGSGTGRELFRIADVRQLRLYVHVPQTYATLMQKGLTAQLQLPDHPNQSYTATLTRTSDAIDPSSRTLLAELMVDNARHELLPGAYVEVHFQLPPDTQVAAYRVPANTLLFRGDGLQIATVDAREHVVLKPVTIGRDFGSDVEITHGLSAGDRVILSPPDSLSGGEAVRIANPEPSRVARS
ncbi:MAG TPA: efflux RND transporter periplasmic adaptor subunit [Steroidobacteraceae bacterium]|jgi:RND family efflux transporter MFP subunit|nr:efflux RND transporter periplasmic adaptor subunit [Steroidobacteraceae bacterium]